MNIINKLPAKSDFPLTKNPVVIKTKMTCKINQ